MITMPITLEQLINTLKQLQPSDRAQVAKALIEIELQSDLTTLIKDLYSQDAIEEVTDNDIMSEIKFVRQNRAI